MLEKDFFDQHQKLLLKIANNYFLRWLLGCNRLPKNIAKKTIVKISENSITTIEKASEGRATEFIKYAFVNKRFSQSLCYNLDPFSFLKYQVPIGRLSPAFAFVVLAILAFPKAIVAMYFFGATTFYVGGGDGICYVGPSSTFSTCHDSASGGKDDTTSSPGFYVYRSADPYWYITRAFFPVNTAGLPDVCVISSAILNLYGTVAPTIDATGTYAYVRLVKTYQASNTALENADWLDCGSDNGNAGRANQPNPTAGASDVALSSFPNGSYIGITLDSTGLSWISKTGYTNLGLRLGHDSANQVPSFSAGGIKQNAWNFATSEETGSDKDPYLEIAYSVGSGFMMY